MNKRVKKKVSGIKEQNGREKEKLLNKSNVEKKLSENDIRYHIQQIANTIDANWAKYHLGCLENDNQLEMVIKTFPCVIRHKFTAAEMMQDKERAKLALKELAEMDDEYWEKKEYAYFMFSFDDVINDLVDGKCDKLTKCLTKKELVKPFLKTLKNHYRNGFGHPISYTKMMAEAVEDEQLNAIRMLKEEMENNCKEHLRSMSTWDMTGVSAEHAIEIRNNIIQEYFFEEEIPEDIK